MSPSPSDAESAASPPRNHTETATGTPAARFDPESGPSSTPQAPPPPPKPSADPRLVLVDPPAPDLQPIASSELDAQPDDIFQIPALAALKLLSAGVEALVRITGDIPPTPPPTTPHIPHMRGMQAEKENIVRNYSEKSLARMSELAHQTKDAGSTPGPPATIHPPETPSPCSASPGLVIAQAPRAHNLAVPGLAQPEAPAIDGVQLRPTPSPEPGASSPSFAKPPPPSPEPYVIIGANSQPLNLQHSAITRKFYSKKPPPIGISDYLLRIHRFCPMSTAVYLATSLYIHRLAVDERAVAVTRRNAHRLLLAGLRVAMKALEDLSYPHAKVAKVGGVSELELARLEISFCFLCGFELVVQSAALEEHWRTMRYGSDLSLVGDGPGTGTGQKARVALPGLRIPTQAGLHGRFSH